jgi:hypothetical protein
VDLGWAGSGSILFGEGPGGVLVSGSEDGIDRVSAMAGDVPVVRLGQVEGDALVIAVSAARLSLQVEDLKNAHQQGIPDLLT